MRTLLLGCCLVGAGTLTAQAQSRAQLQKAVSSAASAPKPAVKVVEKAVYRNSPASSVGPPIPKAVWNDLDKIMIMGNKYEKGGAGPVNYVQAMRCYRRAAELGEPIGFLNVGVFYHKGLGTKQNFTQALQWYTRAAALGSADAMNNLAGMYVQAEGVPKDDCQAMNFLKKGAEAGSAMCMFNLGRYYKEGWCIATPDPEQARQWLQKAVVAGRQPEAQAYEKDIAEKADKLLQEI